LQVSANFINATALTVPKETCRQQRQAQSADCYKQNASSAQIIDAEFVDPYEPATKNPYKADNKPILFIAAESTNAESAGSLKTLKNKFQQAPISTPPPGTYVNIYA